LLPSKNSFSRDYWGYSNGVYSNISLIPNPIHFEGYESLFGDNHNDLRPNVEYCKAAILEKIIYPTGGSSSFDYELNSAANFFYDTLSIDNIIQNGNGLRIKSVINMDGNEEVEKYSYTYHNGKTLIPLSFYNNFVYIKGHYHESNNPCHNYYPEIDWCSGIGTFYSFKSLRSNNSLSSDGFNFLNFVGYDIVDKMKLDKNNISNGSITTSFYNTPLTPYKIYNNDMALPSLANNLTNENGNVLTKTYLTKMMRLLKRNI